MLLVDVHSSIVRIRWQLRGDRVSKKIPKEVIWKRVDPCTMQLMHCGTTQVFAIVPLILCPEPCKTYQIQLQLNLVMYCAGTVSVPLDFEGVV